jgi:RNA polymerase sigma-70 factor (ECF subfamily)
LVTQGWARPGPARPPTGPAGGSRAGYTRAGFNRAGFDRAGLDGAGLDEPTLVVRAQEGDAAAFEELAGRHQSALYRVAVRVLGDPVEAQDALQESLVDAWRRIGRFRADSSFSTWMYRVVTNRCLSMLRSRRPIPVDHVDDQVPTPDSAERSAGVDAGLVQLGRAVHGLPNGLRVCWVLRELEGLGYADIAQITGASQDAVRRRIHRARVQLAEVMRPWR